MTKINQRVVLDLEGYELTAEESEILKHPQVAGVILFTRNYHDQKQLSALTKHIKKKSHKMLIAVDQEGGRVQRFRDGFTLFPPMAHWGEQYQQDPILAKKNLAQIITKLSLELIEVGVNLNFIPVLDLNHDISEIMAGRTLHDDADVVIDLAETIIHSLHKVNMPAVGKHFPGHGAVKADSHLELPEDKRAWEQIVKTDLKPFQVLSSQLDMIMPAHLSFPECDSLPVTFSPYWIQKVLRGYCQYDGIIISDDLTMQGAAVIGDYSQRAELAISSGVDLMLICNHRKGAIAVLESLEKQSYCAQQFERLSKLHHRYRLISL